MQCNLPSLCDPPTMTCSNGQFLLALPDTSATGSTASSKLLVVPAFIKRLLPFSTWRLAAGPYWVVAVGTWEGRL
jgi:hypothetical protein